MEQLSGRKGLEQLPGLQRFAPPMFVYGVWMAWLLAGLVFIARFNSCNVPLWGDEWMYVPALAGEHPAPAGWLWERHLSHRLPLQKLSFLALFKLSGQDFRAAAFFNVAALGLAAFAMIRGARSLRGRTVCADAFFPLLLLNWGQAHNLLVGFQVQFILSTVLAGAALRIVIRGRAPLTPGATLLMGICLILLPLCGANGLLYVPALACWLAYMGTISWSRRRGSGLSAWALATAALLLVPVCILGFEPTDREPLPRPSFGDALKTTAQFLSMGLAKGHGRFWPVAALLVAGLLITSAGVLVRAARQAPQPERSRAPGLLAYLAGFFCLAAGVGWARTDSSGLESRYVTLVAPALGCVYFTWEIYGSPAFHRAVQRGLLVLMVLLVPLDVRAGLSFARLKRDNEQALQRDLLAGAPTFALASRYCPPWLEEEMPGYLRSLHRAGVGPFRSLRGDPAFREVPLDVKPAEMNQVTWEAGVARTKETNSYLIFALPERRFAHGIRIRIAYLNREQTGALLRVCWRRNGQGSPPEDQQEQRKVWSDETTVSIWVNGTIDQFRIYPDSRPCMFHLKQIMLLVPEADSMPHAQTAPGSEKAARE